MPDRTAPAELGYIHVYRPAADDAPRAPTLLLLHGTGGDEHDLVDLGRGLCDAANLLSPRGQVLENGAPRFFRRLAPGILDEADLVQRTGELAAFVSDAAAHYGFDHRRVIAIGFSNGANIAASMLLLRPRVLQAAVLFHPMVPLVPEALPDLVAVPVFIAAGRQDEMTPADETLRLARMLMDAGAAVTVNWHEGGHTLAESSFRAARTWLRLTGLIQTP